MRNKTTYWRFKPWVVVLFLALYTLSICGITAAATWAIVTSVNSSSTGTDSLSDGLDSYMELRKPIIYLYPTATTSISVQLQKPENFTTTYPLYGDGWRVTAQPDGKLSDASGKQYYALYWEGKDTSPYDFSTGFYVTKDTAAHVLEKQLTKIGLNSRERNEFMIYWLPVLRDIGQSVIHFRLTDELQSRNKLTISPAPDSLLRVAMDIKPVRRPVVLPAQKLDSFERKGFAVVEWGGRVVGEDRIK